MLFHHRDMFVSGRVKYDLRAIIGEDLAHAFKILHGGQNRDDLKFRKEGLDIQRQFIKAGLIAI